MTITYTKEELLEAELRKWRQHFDLAVAKCRVETDPYELDVCYRAMRACARKCNEIRDQLSHQPELQEVLPSSFQQRPLDTDEPQATQLSLTIAHETSFPRLHAQRDRPVADQICLL
jgi:hypothetical protein